ncbi:MAG: DUF1294 domain-containing protein [Sphingobium sp.]|jgi:uncharacterized membrane protein YsdA (DUF1294 family)|nr:MAG: DUF1294 domain-containing protein [Sphingobium sp.]
MTNMLLLVALALLVVNGLTFLLFAHDKARARQGGWRVPEAHLLMLALVGGSVGAVTAQKLFRHKTRKEPFRTVLQVIVVLQLGLLAGFLIL